MNAFEKPVSEPHDRQERPVPFVDEAAEPGGDGEPSSSSADENKSKQSSSVTEFCGSADFDVAWYDNSGITRLKSKNGSGLMV